MRSDDPVRERIVTLAFPDDTRFAVGYSEEVFRAIAIGEQEDAVRSRLGEPLNESLYFKPQGAPPGSAMEVGVAQLPPACFGAFLVAGAVEETNIADLCLARGVVEGASKADVLRILGPPTESCAAYSESPGHGRFRMRMVCFLGGRVEAVFRRWN